MVDGTSIIVTMPGTNFSVTYQKRFGNPHLMLTRSWVAASVDFPGNIRVPRSRAFQAAVAKAREVPGAVSLFAIRLGSASPLSLLKSMPKIEQKVGALRWPNAILSPQLRMGMTWRRPSSTPSASPFSCSIRTCA